MGIGGFGYKIKCEINSNKYLVGILFMVYVGKDIGGS